MNKDAWLGAAERLVFESFKRCSKFHSPFSINNQEGWRYWLIHFASSYRARQEYNNILHQNKSAQAHFGRSGLNMLSYDAHDDSNMLYLFDERGRTEAKKQLYDDIPRLISGYGDAINVGDFYGSITPSLKRSTHVVFRQQAAAAGTRALTEAQRDASRTGQMNPGWQGWYGADSENR